MIARTLRDWQATEISANALEPKRGIFADPRTGKTLASELSYVAAAPALGLRKLLVACPLAVGPMWVRELKKEGGFHVEHLFSGELVARAFELGKLTHDLGSFAIVMNEDVIDTLEDQLMELGFDAVIVDESQHMRGVSSRRGMALRKLCWAAKWVRLLTGTPAPKHYGNLWGQLVALDRQAWGRSYWRDFADKYLDYDRDYPSIVLGTKNEAELQEKLLQYVTLVRREDVFGPDQFEFQIEWLDMPADAMSSYRRLATEFVLEDPNLSAKHVLTRITRLQQLAAGYLPGEDEIGRPALMTMHRVKIDAVCNTIDNIIASDQKVVLFHRFKWEGAQYVEECKKRFGKDVPIYTILANDKPTARDQHAVDFVNTQGGAIVIAQTRTGGLGIDLCKANYVLRSTQSFEGEYETQAVVRAFEPGQPRVVVDFRMKSTVDNFIAETLKIGNAMDRAVMSADRASLVYGKITRPKNRVA